MIKLIHNANDTDNCMIDLVTVRGDGRNDMWGSFHEDMLFSRNTGDFSIDGIDTASQALRKANSVDCVILTVEELETLTGKVQTSQNFHDPVLEAHKDLKRHGDLATPWYDR